MVITNQRHAHGRTLTRNCKRRARRSTCRWTCQDARSQLPARDEHAQKGTEERQSSLDRPASTGRWKRKSSSRDALTQYRRQGAGGGADQDAMHDKAHVIGPWSAETPLPRGRRAYGRHAPCGEAAPPPSSGKARPTVSGSVAHLIIRSIFAWQSRLHVSASPCWTRLSREISGAFLLARPMRDGLRSSEHVIRALDNLTRFVDMVGADLQPPARLQVLGYYATSENKRR